MVRDAERRRGRSDDALRRERQQDEHAWQTRPHTDGAVLLVDCLPDEQQMYGETLRYAGIEGVILCDPAQAFETAVATRARVIVVDLTTPDAGLGLVRQLRGDSRTRQSTIIAISARVFPADRVAAERAGCDVFLPKPSLPDVLLAEVRTLLARHAGSV